MQDLHTLFHEQAVEIEILHIQRAADFARAVVGHARAAHAKAAIGNVELVAVTPGAALRHFRALVIDAAAAQVALDEFGDGAILHKGGQHFGF